MLKDVFKVIHFSVRKDFSSIFQWDWDWRLHSTRVSQVYIPIMSSNFQVVNGTKMFFPLKCCSKNQFINKLSRLFRAIRINSNSHALSSL